MQGHRKVFLVVLAIGVAVLNKLLGLGIDADTIGKILLAGVGGAGAVALEDGVQAVARAMRRGSDLLIDELAAKLVDGDDDEDEDSDDKSMPTDVE